MTFRQYVFMFSLLTGFAPKLLADTVSINRKDLIERPMKEVEEILLAFDRTCESNCQFLEPTLLDSKILESTPDRLVIWQNYRQIVPVQTFKIVHIDHSTPSQVTISMEYPGADELASLKSSYQLAHTTSLESEVTTWTLKESLSAEGKVLTETQIDAKLSGPLIKGFVIQIVTKTFNESLDKRFNLLKSAVLAAEAGPLPETPIHTPEVPTPLPTQPQTPNSPNSNPVTPNPNPIQGLTYYKTIKPIIDAHCVGCHNIKGQAPFVLDTYPSVKNKAAWIADVVAKKSMPPWGANPLKGHELKYDNSLSDQKIKWIQDWAKAGAPMGDKSDVGPAIRVPTASIGATDKKVSMLESWTTTANEEHDEYRCFPVTVDTTEPYYVTGFKLEHENATFVHHSFVFSFDPEYAPFVQQMDDSDPGYGYPCLVNPVTPEFYGLQPHTIAVSGLQGYQFSFGDDAGVLVKPGTVLVFQMHYSKKLLHSHGRPEAEPSDLSRTHIHLKTRPAVERPLEFAYLLDLDWMEPGGMKIPAGEKDVSYSYSSIPSQSPAIAATKGVVNIDNGFYINAVFPHQHLLARGMKVSIERADGQNELIFDNMDRYNFHFQSVFQFEKPIFVAKDDKLRVSCYWDNSEENQPEMNDHTSSPSRDVYWGEETGDEMCVASLVISEK